jgi:hypothetical protein
MSYLFGGRPQVSSEQKIAQAEAEIDMVSDMYTRYCYLSPYSWSLFIQLPIPSSLPDLTVLHPPDLLTHLQPLLARLNIC